MLENICTIDVIQKARTSLENVGFGKELDALQNMPLLL